jgi:hypothetical protein
MKKLNLKSFGLEASDLLKRNELKSIFGGNEIINAEAASCTATCSPGVTITCSGTGICTAADGEGGHCEIIPYSTTEKAKKKKCPVTI